MTGAAFVLEPVVFSETEPPSNAAPERSPLRPLARGSLAVATSPDILLNGVSLELSRLQSRIFAALLETPEPLSTTQVAAIAWQGRIVAEHTVHAQVALLRTRVLHFGLRITHLRGRGYVLE